jgi:hypothetical protein
MYFAIKIEPAALLTSLVTILTAISDGINSILYETLYSVSNTRVRDTEVMVLAGTHTFLEALEGCRLHEMSIFVPRQNSDLNTLFAQFSITKTWIDVYYDERKERLNDMRSAELPSLLSDTTRVTVDTAINSNLENTKKFALEKSGSSFKYVPVAKTKKLAVPCHRNLGYPYRNSDLIELNKIKGDIKALIDQKISEVKEQKLYFEAIKNYLPELKPPSDFSLKQATDLQAKNEAILQDIKLKLDLIVADMRKFNELPSYFHVTLPLRSFHGSTHF